MNLCKGPDANGNEDGQALARQLDVVQDLMLDGQWRTLFEIAAETNFPEASISARLRDLRNKLDHRVDRRRRELKGRLYEYRVQPPVLRITDGVQATLGLFGEDEDDG